MAVTEESMVKFDGGFSSSRWASYGFPEGNTPDTYMEKCIGGAINLHVFRMGSYDGCNGCAFQQECKVYGITAGEQAEL